jgi:response regulator RpfG family c-di-GMP phosphodiesterase
MPVMNGWQFLDAVEQRPYSDQIFVIIVTSSIDYEDRIKAQGYSHVIDYIEKPLNIETCERIRQISLINDIINS